MSLTGSKFFMFKDLLEPRLIRFQLNNPQYENFNNWQLRETGCHFMMCNDQFPDTQCLNEGVCVEVVKSITVQIQQDHIDHSTHARSIRNFR